MAAELSSGAGGSCPPPADSAVTLTRPWAAAGGSPSRVERTPWRPAAPGSSADVPQAAPARAAQRHVLQAGTLESPPPCRPNVRRAGAQSGCARPGAQAAGIPFRAPQQVVPRPLGVASTTIVPCGAELAACQMRPISHPAIARSSTLTYSRISPFTAMNSVRIRPPNDVTSI